MATNGGGGNEQPDRRGIRVTTPLDELENGFFDPALLNSPYLRQLKAHYEDVRGTQFWNPHRCYTKLLRILQRIFEYNPQHAGHFAKRMKAQSKDWRSCEAVFAEVIVYAWYVPLVSEGTLARIDVVAGECDVKLVRANEKPAYLEVLCVMPNPKPDETGLVAIGSHTQDLPSSIRQKILAKIEKQGQLSGDRENWVVIELNSSGIAGDFALLSSLSGGCKIPVDRSDGTFGTPYFDWRESVFDGPLLRQVRGVTWFDLGCYSARRTLLNPLFESAGSA